MHPHRKPNAPIIAPIAGTVPAPPATLVDRDTQQTDDAPSPARLLHEHLAARLADAGASSKAASPVLIAGSSTKLPVMLRIAIIVALSAALWSGAYLGIVHAVTI